MPPCFGYWGRRLAVKTIKKEKKPHFIIIDGEAHPDRGKGIVSFYDYHFCSVGFRRAESKCPAHSRQRKDPCKALQAGGGQNSNPSLVTSVSALVLHSAAFTPFLEMMKQSTPTTLRDRV